jgi:DNA polymerase-3 subunit alpha
MTSIFNSSLGQQERMGTVADECTLLGISVGQPDVSRSDVEFTIEGDPQTDQAVIRTGLAAVKNVGRAAVEAIVAERRAHGPFTSMDDFVKRANLHSLNRRALESLIKAGAFDTLGPRGALVDQAERILSLAQQEQKARDSQQGTMFEMMGAAADASLPSLDLASTDVPNGEKAAWEKELTGIYFTEDPYKALRQEAGPDAITCGDVTAEMVGQRVTVAGIVSSIRNFVVRGEPAISVALQDLSGSVDITVWPDTYRVTQELWQPNTPVVVQGRVRVREERASINCDQVRSVQITAQADGEGVNDNDDASGDSVPMTESHGQLYEAARERVEEIRTEDGSPTNVLPDGKPVTTTEGNETTTADVVHDGAETSGAPTNRQPESQKTPTPQPGGKNAASNGSGKRYQLVLQLRETTDEAADLQRFNQVMEVLQGFPGGDPVRLIIHEVEAVVSLDLPHGAAYGPELASRIAGILGEEAMSIQQMLL